MLIGRVIGNVVSTIKNRDYHGHKLMMVQPITPEGKDYKDALIAVDIVGAGEGEIVIFVDEGNCARQLLRLGKVGAARAVIVGIVDHVEMEEGTDAQED